MSTKIREVDKKLIAQPHYEREPVKNSPFLGRALQYIKNTKSTINQTPSFFNNTSLFSYSYYMFFSILSFFILDKQETMDFKAIDDYQNELEPTIESSKLDLTFGIGALCEQIVNTYTTGDQTNPVIGSFPDSTYIVVWQSFGQDGSDKGIYAQRFDVDDIPVGSEFLVNVETANGESLPDITTFDDGGFVITWKDVLPLSHAWPEFRVFNADATPATGEINLKPSAIDGSNEGYNPAVLALNATQFVAIWKSENSSVKSMEGQIYNRSGVAVSGILSIGTLQGNYGHWSGQPGLTLLDNGGFAVSWYDNDNAGTNPISRLRFFDASGVPTSSEIALPGDGHTDVTKILNGNVVVSYGDAGEVSGAIYTETGTLVQSEFQLNTTASNTQLEPSLTALDNGGFYAAWQSEYGDADTSAIIGQRFDATGNPIGLEWVLNTTIDSAQTVPALSTLADGSLRVVWTSNGQDSNGEAVVLDEVLLSYLSTDVCYAIADGPDGSLSEDTLYTISVATGTVATVGPTGAYGIESMAIDPVNEIIYACSKDTVGTIHPATGLFRPIVGGIIGNVTGALGTIDIDDIDGLTFDTISNVLWASERMGPGNDLLFKIDPVSGQYIADAFGLGVDYLEIVTNEMDLDDIAISPDGILYAISNNGASGNQRLGSIHKTTGIYTEIGDYGIQDVEGLAFTQMGQLLGTTGDDGNNDNVFFSVDPTTAEFAYLNSLAPAVDVEACACRHSPYINGIIGDFVWADLDSNGVQDPGEPAVKNVQVNLLNKSGSPALDGFGAPITTTTDAFGFYQFSNLASDSFMIEILLPVGASFSPQNIGSDDTDSDINTVTGRSDTIDLVGGLIRNNSDAGLLNAPVTIRNCTDGGDLFVTDISGSILRFDQTTGALIDTFIIGMNAPKEMLVGPDDYLYVSDETLNEIRRYSLITGALINTMASGLNKPNGMIIGPDGNLYVNNRGDDEVKYYDPNTGLLLGDFVLAGAGGLDSNNGGIEFGPDGNLYIVSKNTNEVLRFNGTTGAFIDTFVSAGSGALSDPGDLVFGSDNNLYVTSKGGDKVIRYDGTTGALIDEFVASGSGGLNDPRHLIFGSDNNLYVAATGSVEGVYRYDGTTGAFIDFFASGLTDPQGMFFALVPGCPEICDNGFDNDGDGDIDCLDSDCCCAKAPVISK